MFVFPAALPPSPGPSPATLPSSLPRFCHRRHWINPATSMASLTQAPTLSIPSTVIYLVPAPSSRPLHVLHTEDALKVLCPRPLPSPAPAPSQSHTLLRLLFSSLSHQPALLDTALRLRLRITANIGGFTAPSDIDILCLLPPLSRLAPPHPIDFASPSTSTISSSNPPFRPHIVRPHRRPNHAFDDAPFGTGAFRSASHRKNDASPTRPASSAVSPFKISQVSPTLPFV
ncbi:hypothetical protein R3P38DRAFT_3275175 [Favolaschia claudopus]|uniref:Polymerase nucleotidyl transferase domain-containing protein n=1 Tax=Favolaschia claudopus TaxID=2862362 RepID=A0AAW0AV03_9AGAR